MPEYVSDAGGGLAELAVPLFVDGEVFGVLDAEFSEACVLSPVLVGEIEAAATALSGRIAELRSLALVEFISPALADCSA